jgi:hypothetical protein
MSQYIPVMMDFACGLAFVAMIVLPCLMNPTSNAQKPINEPPNAALPIEQKLPGQPHPNRAR